MSKNLLLIGSRPDSLWVAALRKALPPAAHFDVVSAAEAEKRLAENAYDLIVLDYSAAGVSLQTLRELRRLRADIPILVVSASPTLQQTREVFAAGGADFIPKSLDAEALREVVQEILSR